MIREIIYKTYRVLGLILFLWTVSIGIYYLVVALEVGYFPIHGHPDADGLDSKTLIALAYFFALTFIISFYCFFIFLGLLSIHLTYNLISKKKTRFKSILISSIGLIVFILGLTLPGSREITDWLLW
jgi:hypothetical protein